MFKERFEIRLTFFHVSVPPEVWRVNIDTPEEGHSVAMETGGDRWWEQVDLSKLILASNMLTSLSEDIANLPALRVLDVRYFFFICLNCMYRFFYINFLIFLKCFNDIVMIL